MPQKYKLLRVMPSNLQECENQLNKLFEQGYAARLSEVTPSGMIVLMEYALAGEPELESELEFVTEPEPAAAVEPLVEDYPFSVNGKKAKTTKPQGKYKRV